MEREINNLWSLNFFGSKRVFFFFKKKLYFPYNLMTYALALKFSHNAT